ncbi:MAG: hypothetical protein AB4368_16885 [Xenococcaceae cyanobacterium]
MQCHKSYYCGHEKIKELEITSLLLAINTTIKLRYLSLLSLGDRSQHSPI